jgi:adenine-specific DNA-methyltransferase
MIRSELDVLLDRIEDPALRADLQAQIDRLKQRRSFGLVFEQHIPERVRLPQHPIRLGSQVVSRDDDDSPTYEVVAIEDGLATLVLTRDANGAYVARGEHPVGERERLPLDSLVVITDFGEPVFPGFRFLGAVERGDKPYHVVINGENHHALEALRFTHAGKVDCIYIDPPYNSGARDWKYNNDYVDDTDAYRHSKWLAFMERRLKLARELLNPDDSALIVTIDEREYLRLGMLLEQTFAGARMQMASIVINPSGTSREELSRVDEYAFFILFGAAAPARTADDMLTGNPAKDRSATLNWESLLRRGSSWYRQARPNLCYPVLIDPVTQKIVGAGPPFNGASESERRLEIDGYEAAWPVRTDGRLGIWRLGAPALLELAKDGYAFASGRDESRGTWAIRYLLGGDVAAIKSAAIEVARTGRLGEVEMVRGEDRRTTPKTVWNRPSHNAGVHGSALLRALIPRRAFPFPKSLYAVEDSIRLFVKDKPNAVVLDFFAGSGTTAHAVMRLNKQDGGRRQSIMVTNNEVSAEEAADLRRRDKRPGEPEWEALGIFAHITRPRVTAAITGTTPEGEPIKGDYKFTDEFPMADGLEENAAFLELRYLNADDVDLDLAYDDIAPLLWLRAGAAGPIARRTDETGTPLPYAWTERYGVLFDEDRWRAFIADCPPTAAAVFIVTNSPTTFAGIVAELPTGMDTVRLYDTYLSMFQPERGQA